MEYFYWPTITNRTNQQLYYSVFYTNYGVFQQLTHFYTVGKLDIHRIYLAQRKIYLGIGRQNFNTLEGKTIQHNAKILQFQIFCLDSRCAYFTAYKT